MEFLSGLLLSIFRANPGPGKDPGTVYIIIRRAHSYLEEVLRGALEGRENVKVIADRRYGERRTRRRRVAFERRQADRRRTKEPLAEVIVGEEASGPVVLHPKR